MSLSIFEIAFGMSWVMDRNPYQQEVLRSIDEDLFKLDAFAQSKITEKAELTIDVQFGMNKGMNIFVNIGKVPNVPHAKDCCHMIWNNTRRPELKVSEDFRLNNVDLFNPVHCHLLDLQDMNIKLGIKYTFGIPRV